MGRPLVDLRSTAGNVTARRTLAAAALAAAAIGTLVSCSSDSAAGDDDSAGSGATSTATGTWTQSGDYQTPGGTETETVTLSAKDGVVTAVSVTGSGNSPNAVQYEKAFASGVSAAVVGKPLATLKVGAISGSSLTPNGFNAAVEKIRADAG